jgi:hypothetical protein
MEPTITLFYIFPVNSEQFGVTYSSATFVAIPVLGDLVGYKGVAYTVVARVFNYDSDNNLSIYITGQLAPT